LHPTLDMEENNTAPCRTCRQSALPIEEFSFWKPGKRYKTCDGCRARVSRRTANAAEHGPVSGWLIIPMRGGNMKANGVI
jgi:hypothetical protein